MAVDLKEQQLAQKVYAALQGCIFKMPKVCISYCAHPRNIAQAYWPLFATDYCVQPTEMAMLGQELMLCKADDFDLIQGHAKPLQQLQFLEELLTLVPGCEGFTESQLDGEALLKELFADKNRAHLTHMLRPTLYPWPAHIKSFSNSQKSSFCQPGQEESDNVAALLQSAGRVLKELQSEVMTLYMVPVNLFLVSCFIHQCEFLHNECQSPAAFSPCVLRVAVSDLRQLTAAFSRVYETDFKEYCNREAPQLSTESLIFKRVHRLLLACNTELKMLEEVSKASAAVMENACQLQTQPCYWSHGEKRTLRE
ncbi:HAUS augmin-like complex subunit 7 [Merluccius polli]|uniref:HAUS augmin-like complex subunit 7 n=1 Tax=Merluccius polli TaxID=89951 RepID=A0AA47P8C7_MERPO|nr:HAUS augmin-like complex subunit 7 [Merluccius polli]